MARPFHGAQHHLPLLWALHGLSCSLGLLPAWGGGWSPSLRVVVRSPAPEPRTRPCPQRWRSPRSGILTAQPKSAQEKHPKSLGCELLGFCLGPATPPWGSGAPLSIVPLMVWAGLHSGHCPSRWLLPSHPCLLVLSRAFWSLSGPAPGSCTWCSRP